MNTNPMEDSVAKKNILAVVHKQMNAPKKTASRTSSSSSSSSSQHKAKKSLPPAKKNSAPQSSPSSESSKPTLAQKLEALSRNVHPSRPAQQQPAPVVSPSQQSVQQPSVVSAELTSALAQLRADAAKAREREDHLQRELATLREQLQTLSVTKTMPVSSDTAQQTLVESMNKLTGVIRHFLTLFVQANKYMEQGEDPVSKRLMDLEDQHEKIANGILALADMIRDLQEGVQQFSDDQQAAEVDSSSELPPPVLAAPAQQPSYAAPFVAPSYVSPQPQGFASPSFPQAPPPMGAMNASTSSMFPQAPPQSMDRMNLRPPREDLQLPPFTKQPIPMNRAPLPPQ